MGIRGELFSSRFASEGRTYFFNVKQNRNGDVFLSIVESKPSEGESFDRRSIVVFGEDMEGFLKTFQGALKFMDKTGNKVAPDASASSSAGSRDDDESGARTRRYAPRTGGETRRPRDYDSPKEGRSSSFREHGTPRSQGDFNRDHGAPRNQGDSFRDRKPALRSGPKSHEAPRSGSSGADKPVKRIVVRRARKPDGEA